MIKLINLEEIKGYIDNVLSEDNATMDAFIIELAEKINEIIDYLKKAKV